MAGCPEVGERWFLVVSQLEIDSSTGYHNKHVISSYLHPLVSNYSLYTGSEMPMML
jgi:hypothetical protein